LGYHFFLQSEQCVDQFGAISCFLGRVLPDDLPGFEHADTIGNFKRTLGALFDEKNSQPVFFNSMIAS
jgi:hypothetical protein